MQFQPQPVSYVFVQYLKWRYVWDIYMGSSEIIASNSDNNKPIA